MSRFIFNGVAHTITLLEDNEEEIGKWTAYNTGKDHQKYVFCTSKTAFFV